MFYNNNKDILNTVQKFLEPIIEEYNIHVWDLEFVKEGKNLYLRIYIDKENSITIDDCELVSKDLEKKLDEVDLIKQPYVLEISSPGINRTLKKDSHFYKSIGKIVDIKLYKARNKIKDFRGELISFKDGVVIICDQNNNKIEFQYKEIASCKLSAFF